MSRAGVSVQSEMSHCSGRHQAGAWQSPACRGGGGLGGDSRTTGRLSVRHRVHSDQIQAGHQESHEVNTTDSPVFISRVQAEE